IVETGEDRSYQPLWKIYSPNGLSVGSSSERWGYTHSSRLKSIPGYIADIQYEADGQTRQITYANGVTTRFSYSPTRRWLTQMVTTRPNGSKLLDNSYTRDKLGRITAINGLDASDSWTYAYDHRDWLKSATNAGTASLNETFGYDMNGNLLTRSRLSGAFTYPAQNTGARPHAPVALGARNFTYDANGNMTSDGQRTLAWDAANRLSRVTIPSGAVVDLAYGPDGRGL
ncbi:hypothetical protein NUU27_25415, partial [Nitratireductor sp. ZSWI3]|nr:hypothetical protein [Nitratireductor sp. ZSWI3]